MGGEGGDVKDGNMFEVGAYFTNWSIYAQKYTPEQIPFGSLNTVYYAFFKPDSDGRVGESDAWADYQIWTDWNDPQANAKVWGCLGKLNQLKQHHKFHLICSIGGWTLSSEFSAIAASHEKRTRFAQSCQELIAKYGFDGIDIDWEYPGAAGMTNNFSAQDPDNLLLLLTEVRKQIGCEKRLSICLSVGQSKYSLLDYTQLNVLLDSYTLMAYDMAGSWSNAASHQSAIYDILPCLLDMRDNYGVDLSLVNLGIPAYGRVFDGCDAIGQKYESHKKIQRPTQTEAALWHYKDLPVDAEGRFDEENGASFAVIPSQCLITYDSVDVVTRKCELLVKNLGLKGVFFWELSGDKSGEDSLVRAAAASLNPKSA